MSEEQNKQTVEDMYTAFGRGDVASILGELTDDVRWITHLEPIVPWSGDHSGKSNVPRFFEAIFHSVDVEAFEPEEWYTDGDAVISTGRFACRAHSTGKSADTRWIFIWKFRDGAVYSYEQFHDAALADAFRP